MILMNVWVTSKYVFHCISKIFVGSITVAIYCLKPIMVFALNGVFTFLRYLIISFLDWALNLRIDRRSFRQLFFFVRHNENGDALGQTCHEVYL